MFDTLDKIVSTASHFLYNGPYDCVPFVLILLIFGGVVFTFRTRQVQITMLGEAFRVILEKPQGKNANSSFGALMVSTASKVGTGNIVGVATAICLGGIGAIFWMWVTAIIGGASAFVESTLAQIYKRRNEDGSCYGGPAYYIDQALGKHWLGVVFSILVIATYAVGDNAVTAYNVQSIFMQFSFYDYTTPYIIGAIMAVLFAVCVLGGGARLTKVCEVLVPFMGIAYVLVSAWVIITNITALPQALKLMFADAFDFKAISSGFAGSCLMYGLKRGLYSNEAGVGSAPNVAATADVSHPAKQGLVQALAVYLDTLLICTATAMICLLSGVDPSQFSEGGAFIQVAMNTLFGQLGPIFLAVALVLFAFTTLIGDYAFCEGCLRFICGNKPGPRFLLGFRLFCSALVMLGSIASLALAWNMIDLLQGIMILVNMPVILILGTTAVRCLEDYRRQRAEGKEPVFRSADIGLKEKTDYWV